MKWIFRRKPLDLARYTMSTKNDGLEILKADNIVGLYGGIVGIADKMRPGDTLVTPHGTWWVLTPRPTIAAARN